MAEMKVNAVASGREDNSDEDLSSGVSNLSLESELGKTGNEKVQEKTDGDEKEQHGSQHGSQTPDQKRVRKGARSKMVPTAPFTPSPEKETPDSKPDEKKDGEWLEGNPWKDETPNREEQMDDTVNMSNVFTVAKIKKWLKKDEKGNLTNEVDLKLIYSQLPKFIQEIKGPSIRKELEIILQNSMLRAIDFKGTPTLHVLEIIEMKKNIVPADNPSFPKEGENNSFKAFSLKQQQQNPQPSNKNYWYLDCEYMLKMYLHVNSEWFDDHDKEGKRIRAINSKKVNERWVFIPSFRRAKIALLDWSQVDIVNPENQDSTINNQESTIRILVVRPSEFNEYVKYCGHEFPVICLPQDEIGAGYARYWIQKIALRLKLQFIWMIDDSVECFYEYHPDPTIDSDQTMREDGTSNNRDYRRRKFGLVFKRIEAFVTEVADDSKSPIAAMSPRRWSPLSQPNEPNEPFVCKPPQGAVYLNLRVLSEKNVYYQPELKFMEDMIFGYECKKKGLKVFMDNRVHLKDRSWKNNGARSPSVKDY